MKKTLISMLVLAGVAMAEPQQLTLTSPAEGVLTSSNAQVNWSEDTGNLNSWALTFTVARKAGATDIASKDLVSTSRTDSAARGIILTTGTDGSIYLKPYAKGALATSEAGVLTLGTETTLTLSFVADVADEYYGFYNGGEAAGTIVGGTFTLTSGENGENTLFTYNATTSEVLNNAKFLKGTSSLWTSGGEWTFSGVGISKLDDNLIPEPATATLSLLAICGLAARRRRK